MAEVFLRGLPELEVQHLPDESRCMICLNSYGAETKDDGAVEAAVRLPCGHDVGAECIRTWLSPDKEAKNSCPACRMSFFPAQPRPYMEHGVFEDEDDLEIEVQTEYEYLEDADDIWSEFYNMANPRHVRNVLYVIGELGQPPEDGPETETSTVDARQADMVRARWPGFLGTTPRWYEESVRRARAVITAPRLSSGVGNSQTRVRRPNMSGYWEPAHGRDIGPEEREDTIQLLATTLRTLPFRESLIYLILRNFGGRSDLAYQLSPRDIQPLDSEQEEVLFREMETRGAFAWVDFRGQYAGLTNRERWQAHRENGEAWNPRTTRWSPFWRL